ncbi:MAG: hypothetical protein C5B51_24065 [Terriglobia bacterium]|nr:MAG: hypothetical protein C5B51_24065 [Terriglobia bacterium]
MNCRRSTWLSVAFLAVVVPVTLLQGQSKPNFSGTWKLNFEKSDFGSLARPAALINKIAHREPDIELTMTEVSAGGETVTKALFTTDGKENLNSARGNTVRSKQWWEGSVLVTEAQGTLAGTRFTGKSRWSLSADGKVLTIERDLANFRGQTHQKLSMEKQ